MDINCLVMDPELIFVNHSGEEVSFTVYPQNKGNLYMELQQLMEFLLTKLNHGDPEAVKEAYAIYEMTLTEGFSVGSMKERVLSSRMEKAAACVKAEIPQRKETYREELQQPQEIHESHSYGQSVEDYVSKAMHYVDVKMERLYKKVGKILEKTPFELRKEFLVRKKPEVEVVLPEAENAVFERGIPEKVVTEEEVTIHPTVCITADTRIQKGILICDCPGEYPDIVLNNDENVIGKSKKAGICIPRETISQNHARVEYQDGHYYIEDMNSTNGTYVNEEPLQYKEKRVLYPGDQLRFADVSYHFY